MRARAAAAVSWLFLAAACGDNLAGPSGEGSSAPDAGTPGPDAGGDPLPDGGSAAACPAEVDEEQLDQGSWDTRFTVAGLTGHDGVAPIVYDFARDADGSLVATGQFQWIGSDRIEPLVRLTDDGWQPARATWQIEPPPAGFAAVAINQKGDLALATYDDFFDGRRGELWLDDGSGMRVIGEFEGLVRSLEWFDGRLWAAGSFTMNGGAVVGIAVWNGTAWTRTPGGSADGPVYELFVDGDQLLAGGAFTSIGSEPAAGIAAFTGTGWTALDMDIEPVRAVFALARGADGALYAGGSFGAFEDGAGAIARRDGDSWTLLGGGVAQSLLPGVVTDLLVQDGSLYVTGCFNTVGGPFGGEGSVMAQSLARWDGRAWQSLDDGSRPVVAPWFLPLVCGDESEFAVWDVSHQRLAAGDDGSVLVGGAFPGAAGVLSQSLMEREGDQWVAQGESGLGLGGWPERIAAGGPDCAPHVFGSFTHAAGQEVQTSVLRFDGAGWEALGERVPPELFCLAFAVSPAGEVALGCIDGAAEPDAGGGAVLRVVDGALERVAAADPLGPVFAIAYDARGRLWITGGNEAGYVARLDGDALVMVADGFAGADGGPGTVTRIDVRGDDDILVAGDFASVDGDPALRIARWDGSAWSGLGDGLASSVTALARDGDIVYASTLDSGGGGGLLLGRFDGESWSELATPESGLVARPEFSFNAMRPVGGVLVAAGSVQLESGERGALVWDGERFRALAGGVGAIYTSDLALSGDALWFTGGIAQAGAEGSAIPTVGVARLALPVRPE